MVAHKTAYNWDGVIANTGPQIGPSVYRALDTFCDLSCGGEVCSFALCYNEGSKPFGLFKRSAPQMPELLGHDDYHTAFSLTATDGQVAYYANTAIQADIPGYYHRPTTFVVGVDVATGCVRIISLSVASSFARRATASRKVAAPIPNGTAATAATSTGRVCWT